MLKSLEWPHWASSGRFCGFAPTVVFGVVTPEHVMRASISSQLGAWCPVLCAQPDGDVSTPHIISVARTIKGPAAIEITLIQKIDCVNQTGVPHRVRIDSYASYASCAHLS